MARDEDGWDSLFVRGRIVCRGKTKGAVEGTD